MKKKMLENEIGHLRERGEAAYEEQNDELLIKFVNCICKAIETQDKLEPPEQERVELVLKSDPPAMKKAVRKKAET